jgi:hypothetical protein
LPKFQNHYIERNKKIKQEHNNNLHENFMLEKFMYYF